MPNKLVSRHYAWQVQSITDKTKINKQEELIPHLQMPVSMFPLCSLCALIQVHLSLTL